MSDCLERNSTELQCRAPRAEPQLATARFWEFTLRGPCGSYSPFLGPNITFGEMPTVDITDVARSVSANSMETVDQQQQQAPILATEQGLTSSGVKQSMPQVATAS